jgi:hypothetical protein
MATTTVGPNVLLGKTVTLVPIKPGAGKLTKPQIHAAIDELMRLSGCPACGLVGFDVRIFGDPGEKLKGAGKLESFEMLVR